MHRHPKLVHPAHPPQLIPSLTQNLQIPCQGGGITAYIDDSVRAHLKHGGKTFLITALAGRVHHNDIRMTQSRIPTPVFCVKFRQYLLCLAHKKLCIVNSVPGRVFSGVRNGLGNDLHTADLPGAARQKQRNGADSTVQIPDSLLSRQPRVLQGQAVQLLSLQRIHLVK